MKYEIKPSSRFKRDMKLVKKRGYDQRLIENVIRTLAAGEEIAASSTEGLQTAEHAVDAMKQTKEIIDATYLLAQDLESYAE